VKLTTVPNVNPTEFTSQNVNAQLDSSKLKVTPTAKPVHLHASYVTLQRNAPNVKKVSSYMKENVSQPAQMVSSKTKSPIHANLVTHLARLVMDQPQAIANLVKLLNSYKMDIVLMLVAKVSSLMKHADAANHVPLNAKNAQDQPKMIASNVKMDTS
jgi:hypothetical protein